MASNIVNRSLLLHPSSNQLVYRQLREKEFRLLKLAPGISDEPINCTLTCHNIDDDIPYIGLSYSWGLVDVVHAITCNDNNFIVSKNVYTALRNLRELILLEQYDRRVWIDGICINQSDPDEKTQQVRMMQHIYKNAAIVVAWLGEMTESDKRAFETLEYVSSKLKLENIYRDDEEIREESLEQTAKLAEKMGIPYIGHKRWADVRQLLDKPWFSRIWIIQEVLHARHFVFLCGSTVYESELIFHFVGNFVKFPFLDHAVRDAVHSSSKGYINACSLAQWKEAWSGMCRYNLSACIFKTLHVEASDPRDKIFALISLACDGEEKFINYKESLESILLMVASYILGTEEGRLDLLSHAQVFGRVKGVPSWVPCWSQKGNRHLGLAFYFSAGRQGFRLHNPSDITLDVDNALIVTSQVIDQVQTIFIPPRSSRDYKIPCPDMRRIDSEEFVAYMVEFAKNEYQHITWMFEMQRITDELETYPTGKPINEIFWRSSIHDNDHKMETKRISQAVEAERELGNRTLEIWLINIMELHSRFRFGKSIISKTRERLRWALMPLHLSLGVLAAYKFFKSGRFSSSSLKTAGLCALGIAGHRIIPHIGALGIWALRTHFLGCKYQALMKAIQLRAAENAFFRELAEVNGGRNYCITKKGYVAWIPKEAEVGDEVCMLDGSRLPFLLRWKAGRENEEGEPGYELLGDVYLHGLMTGMGVYELHGKGVKKRIRIV